MFIKQPVAIVKNLLPPFAWLPQYNKETAICDLIAGITVGLTLIPQSIAYASLAGLGPQYGLYASLCGGIIYAVFGTIPQLNIAPTALLSLLTYTYTNSAPYGAVNAAILLCFFSGIIQLICGILHLGFLIDFVSIPVVAGFTSAGAITIASAQVKNLIGLKFNAEAFVEIWKNVFKHITEAKLWDSVLSIICCCSLLALRQLKDYGIPLISANKDGESHGRILFKKILWFLSVSRNALVVIICASTAYMFSLHESQPFSLTSKITSGLPPLTPPKFSIAHNNATYGFDDMVKHLGTGILVVPFIGILSNVAIAKAFAQGKVVDATQEMLAVGFCNVFGSFLSSMPVCASFSRAAVSNASGTRTPLAGIYTGIMVILALTLLTPYFTFIPKATLASVIICAVLFMVETSIMKLLWNINRIDIIPLLATFIACLIIGIEVGILIGIAVDVLLLLYYNAMLHVDVEEITTDSINYLKISPHSAVLFPAVEKLRERIVKTTHANADKFESVVIDCNHISRVDFTSAQGIASLCNDLAKSEKKLIVYDAESNVERILQNACGDKCIFVKTEMDLITALKGFQRTNGNISSIPISFPVEEKYIEIDKSTVL